MIVEVLAVDRVRLNLVERTAQGANEGAVILDGEGPAIEKDMTIGT